MQYRTVQAADTWSVGLLAHEILTLRHPFLGHTLAGLLRRILTCDYDEQLLRDAPHPEEVKRVATKEELLHIDPEKRLTLHSLLARQAFQVAQLS